MDLWKSFSIPSLLGIVKVCLLGIGRLLIRMSRMEMFVQVET